MSVLVYLLIYKKVHIYLKNNFEQLITCLLTLFRMGLLRAAHGWRLKKTPLLKIFHTCATMMKVGTVIPYLKNIQNIHESRDLLLEFC